MARSTALVFDLIAKDGASPAFLKVAASADKAATATERSTATMAGVASKMSNVGATLTKNLTLPLAAVAAVSVAQAAKYQKSLNTIRVATDQTAASMSQGSNGLLAIAKSTGTSLDQLTDSLYTATKSGQPMAKALQTVKAAAEGAKTVNVDLATATSALTSIMASYGSKLSDPVAAENELIKGSGLAKTTMQDFAASLSNVVPIAASLGISFDQVAGAVDTMTQHGETAQRATENLGNLITNLAGQNNVASQALQQLGVNTVSLSKNLGKDGLTGSLGTVLNAVAKNSKGGLVVTSAFKQAATATASLQTEINAMPKAMQANAKAFANGTLSYKDYYAYTKSLGGQQFAMAKGFIQTEQTAQGFNNQLKSGNTTTKTLAGTLLKALGGVTGMRTALMLSGQSAKTFSDDTKQVAKAATATKGDVLGWATTQDTLATKMDKAKASLQVLGVEIGTALIPAVTKIADVTSTAVGSFSKLSGTQKEIIGWSAGALAALGPILSITGRLAKVSSGIGTFVSTVSTRLSMLAGASATSAARISAGMTAITAGLAGAGIGMAVGTFTQNASTTSKWLGTLGSAAAGAATGFAIGGGLGAVVGGLAGGLTSAAKAFGLFGGSASKQIKPVQGLTQAIQEDNDALGKNTRAYVANQIESKGAYDQGITLGIKQSTLTDAALGNKGALTSVNSSIAAAKAKAANLNLNVPANFTEYEQITKAVNGLTKTLPQLQSQLKASQQAAQNESAAMSTAGKNATANAAAVKQLTVYQTALSKDTEGLNQQLGINGTSLAANTRAGESNRAYISKTITDMNTLAKAQFNSGSSLSTVTSNLGANEAAFKKQAAAAGLSSTAVDKLLKQYALTPKQIVTNLVANSTKATATATELQSVINSIKQNKVPGLKADSAQAKAVVADIEARIHVLDGQTATVHIKTVTEQGGFTGAAAANKVATGKKATGGIISGPGTGTSDTAGVFALSNGEAVIPAKAVSANRGIVQSLIAAGRGMASGGIVHKGKSWIYAGIKYASKRAAENARTRAQQAAAKKKLSGSTDAVSSAIDAVGSASSNPIDITSVSLSRVQSQIATASRTLNQQIAKGLSAGSVKSFKNQIAYLKRDVASELTNLRVRVKGSDVTAIKSALKGTAQDTEAAFNQMFTDISHAGGNSAVTNALKAAESPLLKVQGKLQSAQALQSSISSTLGGAFDPTQYGSATDLIAGLSSATSTNTAYAGEAKKLKSLGLNQTLLNQLLASGQNATLQSLAGSSKAQIAQVNKAYSGYSASVTAGGNAAELAEIGKSVASLTASQNNMANAIAALAAAYAKGNNAQIAAAIKKLTAVKAKG